MQHFTAFNIQHPIYDLLGHNTHIFLDSVTLIFYVLIDILITIHQEQILVGRERERESEIFGLTALPLCAAVSFGLVQISGAERKTTEGRSDLHTSWWPAFTLLSVLDCQPPNCIALK